MSLIDIGAIEEMKRRMQAGPPAPQNASMGAPPPIPSPFLPPNIPAIPPIPEPSPEVYQRAIVSQGPGGLLARPEAPAEYRGLFNRDELMQATPGRVQSLLGRMIGERPQDIMRMNLDAMGARKAQGGEWQDKKTAREDAATLKEQMAALRQKYANGGGSFEDFAKELIMLRPELGSQLAGMVNAGRQPVVQPRNIDPNSPEGIAARLEFERNKPVSTPAPERPRKQLVTINNADGTTTYKWLTEGEEATGVRPQSSAQSARIKATYNKQVQTLANLKDAIATYRKQLSGSGIEVMPGQKKSLLTGSYANLKLLAKEAANLGALTGPDVVILEELFNDPATVGSAALNVLQGGQRAKGLLAQLDQYESIIDGNKTRLEQTYGDMAGDEKKQLSASDLAKAKTDAKFAAWAKANGYEVP